MGTCSPFPMKQNDELFELLKYTIIVDEEGTKSYHDKDGRLHRDDGPAIEWADGSRMWYKHGNYHREDGPAIMLFYGYKAWYINDHRYTEKEFNDYIKSRRI